MAEPLRWTEALLATTASLRLVGQWSNPVAVLGHQAPLLVEERLVEPTDFSPEELKLLQRRFGVHNPQTQLAQLSPAELISSNRCEHQPWIAFAS